MKRIFITGTDTGVGKTYITVGLIQALTKLGYRVIGMKPIASGCHGTKTNLVNDDALLIQAANSFELPYHVINPIRFTDPIAPNVAAVQEGIELNVKQVVANCQPALSQSADIFIIEGVGGWLVPLNDEQTMADVAKSLEVAIIVVVGIRLGCINHSLLTQQAIAASSLPVIGWVANCIDEAMLYGPKTIATLQKWLSWPLLGVVGLHEDPAEKLDVTWSSEIRHCEP